MTIHNLICPFFLVKFQSEDELGLSCEGSENARQIELEQRILETRLRQQQLQSEEDSKWLLKEENNLKKRLSITASVGSDDLTGSTDNVEAACGGGGGTGSSAASTGLSGGSSSAASTGLSGGSSAAGGGGSSRSAESSPRQHSLETKDKPVVVKVRTFFLLSPSPI